MKRLFLLFSILLFIQVMPLYAQETYPCPVDFAGYLEPRLELNQRARVLADTTLNIRPAPTVNQARIGTLATATNFDVLDEMACNEGYVWWSIQTDDGIQGWIAEGILASADYFVEPRGTLQLIENDEGLVERYIETSDGILEHEGCMTPPDNYDVEQLGYARLNERTLFMLDNAQRIYDSYGGSSLVNFRQLITQGSYNTGGVAASFGTHDGGGAVDIAVRSPVDWSIMENELVPMVQALRIAGFAAWVRDTGELYPNSPIHIHAIAIGDADASPIAKEQVSSYYGYFSGYNGLPPVDYAADGESPLDDLWGEPVMCQWMVDMGFELLVDTD